MATTTIFHTQPAGLGATPQFELKLTDSEGANNGVQITPDLATAEALAHVKPVELIGVAQTTPSLAALTPHQIETIREIAYLKSNGIVDDTPTF